MLVSSLDGNPGIPNSDIAEIAIIRSHEATTEACTIPTAVILPPSVMPRTSPSIEMLRIQLGFVYVH